MKNLDLCFEEVANASFEIPDRLATFLGLTSALCLGTAGTLVLLPPAMCGLQRGRARDDGLESLLWGSWQESVRALLVSAISTPQRDRSSAKPEADRCWTDTKEEHRLQAASDSF